MEERTAAVAAVDPAVADEVLSTIADSHRLRIVIALGSESTGVGHATLRFSEIWDATDMEDSGRLNYHLQQLVEREYVASVTDGYRLTLRGLKAYQAVMSGFYASDFETDPVELDVEHVVCDDPITASYSDQRVSVDCPTCETELYEYPVPPGPFEDATMSQIVAASDLRFKIDVCSMSRGFCPYCSGPTESELSHEYYDHLDVREDPPAVLYWCVHCHWYLVTTIESPLLFHPVVAAFFAARGVDIWSEPRWGPVFEVERAVLRTEPLEVLIEFCGCSETLEVVVDRELTVVRSEVREE